MKSVIESMKNLVESEPWQVFIIAMLVLLVTFSIIGAARWWIGRRSRTAGTRTELAGSGSVAASLTEPPQHGTAYLVANTHDGTPMHFALTYSAVTVGRIAGQGPSIVLDPARLPSAQTVSEQHARIELDGREHILVDLDSTNGVLVSGHRAGQVVLSDGAHILLGTLALVYHANGLTGGAA